MQNCGTLIITQFDAIVHAYLLSEFCELCPPGTYQNHTGQATCDNCPAGYVSTSMKNQCDPCPEGTYSLGDGSLCEPCSGSSDCRCMADPYPCHEETRCYNLANDGSSFGCGDCPPGYTGDGVTCTDVDEVNWSKSWVKFSKIPV